MWLLTSKANPDNVYTIVGGKTYNVGRQHCDITIADSSVSRNQAELTMVHHESDVMKSFVTPTLTLHDVSKFGTFVNGKCVRNTASSKKVSLQDGDEIKFGGSPVSVFRVSYTPFVTTTSCIEKGPKRDLVKAMCLLGGHLVREWRPNCQLLIMSTINVTIKVVCALNSQRHIVMPNYLEDLYAYHLGTKDKPDPMKYLPDVVDNEVPPGVSFHPDERRATLLAGLKVYFLSAVQFNKTNVAVSTAGGQPILQEDGSEEDAEAMARDNTVVINVSKSILDTISLGGQKFIRRVFTALENKDRRSIADPEVGWAILTCNIEKFCNPTSKLNPTEYAEVASQMTQLSASQMELTDDVLPRKRSFVDQIENSFRDDLDSLAPSKRQRRDPTQHDQSVVNQAASEKAASSSVDKDENLHISPNAESSSSSKKANLPSSEHTSTNANTSKPSLPIDSSMPGVGKNTKSNHSPKISGSHNGSDENDNMVNPEKRRSKSSSSRQSTDLFSNSHQPEEKIVSDFSKSSVANLLQKCSDKDDDQDTVVSIFAKRQEPRTKKRKFDSDDSDEEPFNSRKAKGFSKRKGLFSFGNEEDDNGQSNRAAKKRLQADKNDSFGEQSEQESRHVLPVRDEISELDKKTEDTANRGSSVNNAHSVNALPKETHPETFRVPPTSHRSGPVSGWLSVSSQCLVKQEPHHVISQDCQVSDSGDTLGRTKEDKEEEDKDKEEEEMKDIKPVFAEDHDVLLDNQGRPLRNLCEVKVVNLLARPVGSRRQQTHQVSTVSNLKNFKNFKKTQHAGSGHLPTIIGGRDLEVYTGDRHKDIEHLFAVELEDLNQRVEEEQRARKLFDWDSNASKAKKATTKRRVR